ncbi:MAG: NUDIX domain-containing protein [Gammaproteobacteria bacterium]|jgi:8-oxo-dGTP pyrophosphatase MutT (NUDIX family)|nr:NUDIX domain-containing protein [Gammaproteobacteria bacterium]
MIWKPHATVAAIIERDNKFLMVEELIRGERLFNQPAGHLDPDESLIDAVIRETQEESAWQFIPEAVTGIYLWKHPDNGETFLRIAVCGSCANHDAQQALDDGIIEAVWKSREELAQDSHKLRSPMVINCIDDYLAGKRYPLDMLINVP